MKKSRVTSLQMEDLYKKFKSSGLSRQQFCKRENLTYTTFGYWIKKYEISKGVPSFKELVVPVAVQSVQSDFPELIVEFPSGAKLRLFSLVDSGWLKSLL